MTQTFAVLGDLHGSWGEADVAYFNALGGLDGVLIVGDLAGLRWSGTLAVARGLAGLECRAIAAIGNHDGPNPVQLLAEVAGRPAMGSWFTTGLGERTALLQEAYGGVECSAWGTHRFDDLTVLTGRPGSMGGPSLAFAEHLKAAYGVSTLEESAERYARLIEACDTERLVFLCHNGPAGLGSNRDSIWGCDFKRGAGDWGDPDLEGALDYARQRGHRVLAVVAGHMHRRLRGGGRRVEQIREHGTLFVNAAEVPRVTRRGRHHVKLVVSEHGAEAEDVWVS